MHESLRKKSKKWVLKCLLIALCITCYSNVFAQKAAITGKVINSASNEALVGATVLEKGTTNGVLTGPDGRFSISVSPGATLQISFVVVAAFVVAVSIFCAIFFPLRHLFIKRKFRKHYYKKIPHKKK